MTYLYYLMISAAAFSLGFAIMFILSIVFKDFRTNSNKKKSKAGGPSKAKLFSLSYNDVCDHINEMKINPERFPKLPNIKERANDILPYYLCCGERTFGLMFERKELVFMFLLRLSEDAAKYYKVYHTLESSDLGENWYSLVIDQTFESKKDVYQVLNESYHFVLKKFGREKDNQAAKDEQACIEKDALEHVMLAEKRAADAERKYRLVLEGFKTKHYKQNLVVTRKEIAADIIALGNPDLTVSERPQQPQLPMSLKYKGKTYAMLFGTDAGVLMIVRIDDVYADILSIKHPEICRSKFPKGRNWYFIPVDGAFKNKEEVYRVLEHAREFVISISLKNRKPYG